jgi:hypothetical protein
MPIPLSEPALGVDALGAQDPRLSFGAVADLYVAVAMRATRL